MKKMTAAQIIFCTFTAFTPLASYAGATSADGTRTNGTSSTTEVAPGLDAQNMSTNEATNLADRDNGDDKDYGWIGMIGLLGLAGLMRKDSVHRVDTTNVPNR